MPFKGKAPELLGRSRMGRTTKSADDCRILGFGVLIKSVPEPHSSAISIKRGSTMTTPNENLFVQVYVFEHRYGRGCTCTVRSAQMREFLIEKHGGEAWEDRYGNYFFEGPFKAEEDAKRFVMDTEFYIPSRRCA